MKFCFSRFSCQDTQNDVKRSEKCFKKNIHMDGCLCMQPCMCVGMYMYVHILKEFVKRKFKPMYLRNCSADRAENWCAPKVATAFSLISFWVGIL